MATDTDAASDDDHRESRSRADVATVLREGDVEIKGRMPWSSNATFLTEVCREGDVVRAVYKPERGERPLWDFPPGLHTREVAAYELSEALGWGLVPVTVRRFDDAPLGEGSLQAFIDADFEHHYFTLLEDKRYRGQLQQICVFDLLANSTDRKGGHILLGPDHRLYAVDNGLSFHVEFKLRTVIWDFAGEPIPEHLLDDVARLAVRGLPSSINRLLDPDEREAVLQRAAEVVDRGVFPHDPTGRRYPWPLV
jgi:uncharacterized repeat protein (TIGR03843 family)